MEVNILRSINPHFAKVKVLCFSRSSLSGCVIVDFKDTVVKQNLIRTIDLIGKALHPDHLKTEDFVFTKRGDLINHLLVSLQSISSSFYFDFEMVGIHQIRTN